jgi:hypothetical protein
LCEFDIPCLKAASWSEEPLRAPSDGADQLGFLDVASGPPDVAFVESSLRRRLSRMARGMFHCAQRVAPEPGDMRVVFASRHGEVARTMTILEDLAKGEQASPTAFSMNVHNAAAGLWSIIKQNHGPSTALGAGPETFGWGLIEAYAAFAADPRQPVLYVFGEERLPDFLEAFEEDGARLHAVALLIGTPSTRRIRVQWDPEARGTRSGMPQSLHGLEALRGVPLGGPWQGETGSWAWHVD